MAPPLIAPGGGFADLRLHDFEASLAALDGDALRSFLSDLDPNADHRVALIEFAARHAGGAPYLDPDPTLLEEAVRAVRGCKRRGDHNRPEVRRVLERARRLLLRGDVDDARKVYELVLGSAADLSGTDRREHEEGAVEADRAGFADAGSYLVSVYESAPSESRVDAMLDAVERLSAVDVVASPIELMLASAPRALGDIQRFTREWAALLEALAEGVALKPLAWSPSHAMLAEALERLDGLEGIARAARRTGDLTQYRTWVTRVVAEGRFGDAIAIASEAGETLSDAFGRGVMLDAALTLAQKVNDRSRIEPLVERAFFADPSTSRLARWLLYDSPTRQLVAERSARLRESGIDRTPRMDALLFALEGSIEELVGLLEAADDGWGADDNSGPLAYPAVLMMLYGGPKATPVTARVCAPLFSTSLKPDVGWRGWSPANSLFGEPSTPDPGPFIVELAARRPAHSLHFAPRAAEVLRQAAAVRAAGVLASRERSAFDATASLVVAAAESTLHVGESDAARAYLGQVAVAAAAHPAFRTALTKTLAKSTLVSAL